MTAMCQYFSIWRSFIIYLLTKRYGCFTMVILLYNYVSLKKINHYEQRNRIRYCKRHHLRADGL